jgi:peptidoglycan/xylan/chitin deacetylase (PgdA/CDA1 family)
MTADDFSKGIILMYHRVAEPSADPWGLSVTPAHFAEQLQVLRQQANPRRLGEIARIAEGERVAGRPVALTFDDGYADNLYEAKPLLEEYEVPATCFVTTGYLGNRSYWWDELEQWLLHPGRLPESLRLGTSSYRGEWKLNGEGWYGEAETARYRSWRAWEDAPTIRHQIYATLHSVCRPMRKSDRQPILEQLRAVVTDAAEPPSDWRPMTEAEVIELAAGGLVEIGAHTITHPVLATCSDGAARREIAESRRALEQLLGRPVTSFAFPFGGMADYNQATVEIVHEAGFRWCCSTTPDRVSPGVPRWQLPRFQVEDWTGREFAGRLAEWFGD